MAYPSLLVEVAWASAPLAASPTYTDVTDYVVSVETKRGRQYETDVIEAGTATIVFDNSDARFTPERATLADGSANPYYPNVDKNKLVRISVVWSGTTYRLYTGFIESFATKGGSSFYGEQTVTCVDLFKYLGLRAISTGYKDTILADSPVAYYPLDEDSSATSAGNVATTAQGTFVPKALTAGVGNGSYALGDPSGLASDNQALALNNSLGTGVADDNTGYTFQGPFPKGLSPGATTYTIEAWIKPNLSMTNACNRTPSSAFTVPIAGFQTAGKNLDGGLMITNWNTASTLNIAWIEDTTGNLAFNSAVNLLDGKYHHIAISVSASAVTWFVDGVSRGTNSVFSFAIPANVTSILMGGPVSPRVSELSYRGSIAHVAFYAAALNSTQIAKHYSVGIAGFAGESETTRMSRYLGYLNSPYAVTGNASVTTLAQVSATSDALAAIQESASSAGGIAFIDGTGNVAYRNRNARAATTSVATFADSAGTSVDADPTFTFDDTHVMDDVTISRSSGSTQRVVFVSQPLHPTSLSTDVNTDAEALYQAQWFANVYQQAHTRCDEVSVSPTAQATGTMWSLVLPREIGDRITLGDLPAYAPATSMDFFVEQVSYNITPNGANPEWKASFQLSPAVYTDQIFVLDSPTRGKLDSSRLYY